LCPEGVRRPAYRQAGLPAGRHNFSDEIITEKHE